MNKPVMHFIIDLPKDNDFYANQKILNALKKLKSMLQDDYIVFISHKDIGLNIESNDNKVAQIDFTKDMSIDDFIIKLNEWNNKLKEEEEKKL